MLEIDNTVMGVKTMSKIQYLGSGIEVINYPTFEKTFPERPDKKYFFILPEADVKVHQIAEFIKENRGQFISGCIDIENLLSQVISYFFFENDSEKRELFHIFILDTVFLSFGEKKKLLGLLMKKYPQKFSLISDTKRHEAMKTFDDLIRKRNAFAHGKIVIDYQAMKTVLIYYNTSNNQNDEIILSKKEFLELHGKVVDLCGFLLPLTHSECSTSIEHGGIRIDRFSEESNTK